MIWVHQKLLDNAFTVVASTEDGRGLAVGKMHF